MSKLTKEKINKRFTPTSPAVHNYVEKGTKHEELSESAYQKGCQIIVYGESGVGKTSLIWSQLVKEEINFTRIGIDTTITRANFCSKVMEELGFQKTTQKESQTGNGTEASIGAGAKLWSLIDFKGTFKANSNEIKKIVNIPYYSEADIDAVSKALYSTNSILFIDDIEKADDELRILISHLGKKLSDDSAGNTSAIPKIIYAGISNDVDRLIITDESLSSRLTDYKIEVLSNDDIAGIITDGFDSLGISYDKALILEYAKLCCGYPRYAHWIGLKSALNSLTEGREEILEVDLEKAITTILEKFEAQFRDIYDVATSHTSGKRMREKILFALASSDEVNVPFAQISKDVGKLMKENIKPQAISGPLGELKKDERKNILCDGKTAATHRFSNLLMKPFVRMVMREQNITL
ncbi:hypothetical protein [Fusibacter ferrireducens]|uniref:AAA+ ATPase domain-containing protein n=1 Tax=Fusibacter ferrireducens TaxID=2785058 RepID=A0ABR9ZZP3_9FIRM|nr:hypothetical protein [Fusibacter ferrireducens]MBF4695089.1 hypothetical protein [Fusibacter ferrireducens]